MIAQPSDTAIFKKGMDSSKKKINGLMMTDFPKQWVVGSISALEIAPTVGIIRWVQNGHFAEHKLKLLSTCKIKPRTSNIMVLKSNKVNLGCISSGHVSVYCLYFNLLNDTKGSSNLIAYRPPNYRCKVARTTRNDACPPTTGNSKLVLPCPCPIWLRLLCDNVFDIDLWYTSLIIVVIEYHKLSMGVYI